MLFAQLSSHKRSFSCSSFPPKRKPFAKFDANRSIRKFSGVSPARESYIDSNRLLCHINVKIGMPWTVRRSYHESRWRGPSFTIGSSCRTSCNSEEVYFPFELLEGESMLWLASICWDFLDYVIGVRIVLSVRNVGTYSDASLRAFLRFGRVSCKLVSQRGLYRCRRDRSKWFLLRYPREITDLSFFSKPADKRAVSLHRDPRVKRLCTLEQKFVLVLRAAQFSFHIFRAFILQEAFSVNFATVKVVMCNLIIAAADSSSLLDQTRPVINSGILAAVNCNVRLWTTRNTWRC